MTALKGFLKNFLLPNLGLFLFMGNVARIEK
jgi:hypothetical protein